MAHRLSSTRVVFRALFNPQPPRLPSPRLQWTYPDLPHNSRVIVENAPIADSKIAEYICDNVKFLDEIYFTREYDEISCTHGPILTCRKVEAST